MINNFLIEGVQILMLVISIGIVIIALLRYFSVSLLSRVSWKWLVLSVVANALFFSVFVSCAQYATWQKDEVTRVFITQPLASNVPLPFGFEWMRASLEKQGGYFVFYAFGRFFLGNIILFATVGVFAFFLRLRARYRPLNFAENDIMAIAIAMLAAGWPGVIALVPLGFLCAIIISIGARIGYGIERIYLPPAFLIASPFALIFGVAILKHFHLYTLLKL